MTPGQTLRKAREAQGISLRRFAMLHNLSPSYYSKLERGEALPSAGTLEALALALGLDPQPLLHALGLIAPGDQALFEAAMRLDSKRTRAALRRITGA